MEGSGAQWEAWVEQALFSLQLLNRRRTLHPIHISNDFQASSFPSFDGPTTCIRAAVEFNLSEPTFNKWLDHVPSSGNENGGGSGGAAANGGPKNGEQAANGEHATNGEHKKNADAAAVANGEPNSNSKIMKLISFSGNDYLGMTSHPAVRNVAAKAVLEHGMGPRSSDLVCGYTNIHALLETSLAELKRKEDCVLFPTGFSACMAFMVTAGSVASVIAGAKPSDDADKVAIFSDALNHASIIDGIHLASKHGNSLKYVYQHCDMSHLDSLLSQCPAKKKVVITDGLFSMDGDFAPMVELAKLRKKHGFLLVVDDAHGTLIWGKSGRGTGELFDCEDDIDIYVSCLSKAVGCQGGFVACSKKWKQLMLCVARSYIFTTSLTVPEAAAAYAAVVVAKKESWRRHILWERVKEFRALIGKPIESQIIPIIVGTEEKAVQASRELVRAGFHANSLIPPMVPKNECRIRLNLNSAHTKEDLVKLTNVLSKFINVKGVPATNVDNL